MSGEVLTADLVARAVIAAARSYGDDPVRAMQAVGRANDRRSLTAAVGGLARALELPVERAGAVLRVKKSAVYTNRSKRIDGYLAAEASAMRAVEFALADAEPEGAEDDEALPTLGELLDEAGIQPASRPRPMRPNPTADDGRATIDLVVEVLAQGPRDSMNIASMIDRKEVAVVSALQQLRSERKAIDEPVKDGPRKFRWRLVA